MCSDGAWLNGWSKLASAANRKPANAVRLGLGEGEAQRKQDEAGDRDDLRRQQAAAMRVELVAASRRRTATGRRTR